MDLRRCDGDFDVHFDVDVMGFYGILEPTMTDFSHLGTGYWLLG